MNEFDFCLFVSGAAVALALSFIYWLHLHVVLHSMESLHMSPYVKLCFVLVLLHASLLFECTVQCGNWLYICALPPLHFWGCIWHNLICSSLHSINLSESVRVNLASSVIVFINFMLHIVCCDNWWIYVDSFSSA